jgi:hypothetical protein
MVKVDYVMCAFYEMKMVVVDLADCLSWVSGYFGLFLIIHHYEQDQTYGCRGPCRGPPLVGVLIMIMILVGIDWVSRQKMLLPLQAYPRGTLPE